MAINSSIPGISVTVHNDQGQLSEYADDEPDIVENLESACFDVVSNYIEAPPDGGPFRLKFRVKSLWMESPYNFFFKFGVPGTNIQRWVASPPVNVKDKKNESWIYESRGYSDNDERGPIFRSFKFAQLKVLSGDGQSDGLSETERMKMESIGVFEIRILVGRLSPVGGLQLARKPKQENYITPTVDTITEKVAARKSLSLGIAYTDEALNTLVAPATPVSPVAPVHRNRRYIFVQTWNRPLAIFQFKCRSRADLQRLLLIEKSPESHQLPKEHLLPMAPTTTVPILKQEPGQGQQRQELQHIQPAPEGLSTVTTPADSKAQMDTCSTKGKQHLQANQNSATTSRSPFLASTSKVFEKLTSAEVHDLAEKQYKSFNELGREEVLKLAKQMHSEAMSSANCEGASLPPSSLSYTSTPFEDLTHGEVLDLARNKYKDFDQLSIYEIEKLARQRHSEIMTSSQAAISGASDERNGQGKRKASIKVEDADDDLVLLSASVAKKRK